MAKEETKKKGFVATGIQDYYIPVVPYATSISIVAHRMSHSLAKYLNNGTLASSVLVRDLSICMNSVCEGQEGRGIYHEYRLSACT